MTKVIKCQGVNRQAPCPTSEEFELSESEVKFYTDKGLSIPKRCPDCRAKKKAYFEKKERREQGQQ